MAPHELASLEWLTRQPFLLAPNRVYRVWKGGALLDRLQGKPQSEDSHFPEEWVGSTTVSRLPDRDPEEGLSRVALPDGSAVLLKSLVEAFPEAMLGAAHVARYGRQLAVLCKLLDSAVRLPIQCHPNRDFAWRHLRSEFGKTVIKHNVKIIGHAAFGFLLNFGKIVHNYIGPLFMADEMMARQSGEARTRHVRFLVVDEPAARRVRSHAGHQLAPGDFQNVAACQAENPENQQACRASQLAHEVVEVEGGQQQGHRKSGPGEFRVGCPLAYVGIR